MPPSGFFLDANLFVLLVVGSVGRDLIAKHRRLRAYSAEDYEILIDLLDRVERVFVTPNTLTETSNLLAQHAEPERSRFFDRLRFIIHESEEIVVASAVASSNSAFNRLGLTDAALLEVVTPETPLVTVTGVIGSWIRVMQRQGLPLPSHGLVPEPLAANASGQEVALNFTHLRNL